ncbi:MAG: YicC family protein [Oleiphilus sp.]|nr:MAG: YicC family protein [Oleiphilus sp.]
MLKSMTAFSREDIETEQGVLTWEIRSVNHRYLEPAFRIPELFREAEPSLRDVLRRHLARGKVDCSLKWQPDTNQTTGLKINPTVLSNLHQATSTIRAGFDNTAPVNVMEVLAWPGIIEQESADSKPLLAAAISCFDKALIKLGQNRTREGKQLEPLLEERLEKISSIVAQVRQKLPEILELQSNTIKTRFEEARVELDNQRLEQELVLLAQKSDVAEELDRLDAHVIEVRSTLKKDEPVGRRLDFLMQELNREANTLSSKAIVTDTTRAAVELKVLIEQMREQVQNIE